METTICCYQKEWIDLPKTLHFVNSRALDIAFWGLRALSHSRFLWLEALQDETKFNRCHLLNHVQSRSKAFKMKALCFFRTYSYSIRFERLWIETIDRRCVIIGLRHEVFFKVDEIQIDTVYRRNIKSDCLRPTIAKLIKFLKNSLCRAYTLRCIIETHVIEHIHFLENLSGFELPAFNIEIIWGY